MTDHSFSAAELAHLRTHGIVLFADRVIFEAQPPMTDAQIAEVQAACAGPIPAPLIALWQQTAGGRPCFHAMIWPCASPGSTTA